MAKLPRPRQLRYSAPCPGPGGRLEAPWRGPPPFLVAQAFRVEEAVQDDGYVIRADCPDGAGPRHRGHRRRQALTIRAERRQEGRGPSLRVPLRLVSRSVGSPPRLTPAMSPPAQEGASRSASRCAGKAGGTRVPIEKADSTRQEPRGRQEPAEAPRRKAARDDGRSDVRQRPAAAEACDVLACPDGCAPQVEQPLGV